MRGIELSFEEREKHMQAFILGGITGGAVAGGVTTLTGGLDTAMTFNLINRLVVSIASGVFAAEHYAYHSKGADPKGKAGAIHSVSNTRSAAINAFIDLNF